MKMNLEVFAQSANRIRRKASEENRLLENPSDNELKKIMLNLPGVVETIYGNLVVESEPTSRAAMSTKNSVDSEFGIKEIDLLSKCEEVLSKSQLISVDRIVGKRRSDVTVRLIILESFAHVAYGGKRLFLPSKGVVKE